MRSNIGDNEAKIIALALRGNTSLERLYLSDNNIGDDGVIALAAAVKDHPSLEAFYISHNQFGDAGVEALNNVHAIQRNQQLNHPPRRSGCTVS